MTTAVAIYAFSFRGERHGKRRVNDAKESLKVAEEPMIQGKGVASLSEIIVSSQIRRDTRWAPH